MLEEEPHSVEESQTSLATVQFCDLQNMHKLQIFEFFNIQKCQITDYLIIFGYKKQVIISYQ